MWEVFIKNKRISIIQFQGLLMKIIEALKELPLLEKRIQKQTAQIGKYASYGSHVGSAFETEAKQRTELAALVQSNNDLVNRYLSLRKVLNKTNTEVLVTIDKLTLSISEWIAFREKGGKMLIDTFQALTINNGSNDIRTVQANLNEGAQVGIVRCFDEKLKNVSINEYQEILDKIDATLEMVNATTDLVEAI